MARISQAAANQIAARIKSLISTAQNMSEKGASTDQIKKYFEEGKKLTATLTANSYRYKSGMAIDLLAGKTSSFTDGNYIGGDSTINANFL